jgi:small nuclear ribonucleoprotein (snRNP)-like protein
MAADSYRKEFRRVTVKTSDGSTLTGRVNLGIKDRVSDLFTRSESPFVVLTDVETRDGSGKTLIVNKNQIVWVEPND